MAKAGRYEIDPTVEDRGSNENLLLKSSISANLLPKRSTLSITVKIPTRDVSIPELLHVGVFLDEVQAFPLSGKEQELILGMLLYEFDKFARFTIVTQTQRLKMCRKFVEKQLPFTLTRGIRTSSARRKVLPLGITDIVNHRIGCCRKVKPICARKQLRKIPKKLIQIGVEQRVCMEYMRISLAIAWIAFSQNFGP